MSSASGVKTVLTGDAARRPRPPRRQRQRPVVRRVATKIDSPHRRGCARPRHPHRLRAVHDARGGPGIRGRRPGGVRNSLERLHLDRHDGHRLPGRSGDRRGDRSRRALHDRVAGARLPAIRAARTHWTGAGVRALVSGRARSRTSAGCTDRDRRRPASLGHRRQAHRLPRHRRRGRRRRLRAAAGARARRRARRRCRAEEPDRSGAAFLDEIYGSLAPARCSL